MITVYKYPLLVTDEQVVGLPVGARILHVAKQGFNPGFIQMWALVDTEAEIVGRMIRVHGTGHRIETDGVDIDFIGTVVDNDHGLVWHVFQEIP